MSSEQIRSLKATELKLLQERTKLQRRIEEAMSSRRWEGETVHELDHRRDQLEEELQRLRAELRRLDRENAGAAD